MNREKITKYIKDNYGSFFSYSKKTGISRATLSRYMSNDRRPDYTIAKKIVHESKGYITYEDLYGKDKYLGKS